jgi:hypothetical protein
VTAMGVEAKGNCVLTEPSTATTTSFVQMDQQPKTSSNLGMEEVYILLLSNYFARHTVQYNAIFVVNKPR